MLSYPQSFNDKASTEELHDKQNLCLGASCHATGIPIFSQVKKISTNGCDMYGGVSANFAA